MGKGWKTGEETHNQQCCLLRCISIVFYLLLCLIYGTLYNEGVLQSLWVLETAHSRRVVLHFQPFPLFYPPHHVSATPFFALLSVIPSAGLL